MGQATTTTCFAPICLLHVNIEALNHQNARNSVANFCDGRRIYTFPCLIPFNSIISVVVCETQRFKRILNVSFCQFVGGRCVAFDKTIAVFLLCNKWSFCEHETVEISE